MNSQQRMYGRTVLVLRCAVCLRGDDVKEILHLNNGTARRVCHHGRYRHDNNFEFVLKFFYGARGRSLGYCNVFRTLRCVLRIQVRSFAISNAYVHFKRICPFQTHLSISNAFDIYDVCNTRTVHAHRYKLPRRTDARLPHGLIITLFCLSISTWRWISSWVCNSPLREKLHVGST